MSESTEIGAYEAKTRLPEYLRKVREGRRFTITQRGAPVAELVPVDVSRKQRALRAAARMRELMERTEGTAEVDIRALIDEGRD
ncbi:MAG: type II toxin-antitoxin system prevent-host-death family antitoxin [Burkholderiaceae bacterium]|nr:type II toxin-antitoxin system prevent-host-death family antitoxin [Burkholderiaceae bacterium]